MERPAFPADALTAGLPPGKSIFWKTRVCIKWRQNQCLEGEHCNFAHGEHELRVLPPDLVAQLDATQLKPKSSAEPPEPALLKTKLCTKFVTTGHCPYGATCIFAHGHEELRTRPPATPRPPTAPPGVAPPKPPPPPDPSQASYLDTVRALCAMQRVGCVALTDVAPEAHAAAVLALQSGRARQGSAYADGMDFR